MTRDDGSSQWAYKGKPLYTFIKDKKAGETTGDGMKDVWHVAKP
ncbi:Putative lipoprotein [Pseudomonas putida]|nr:Putative lipoprotein [Pseudomonas putida]